MRFDRYVFAANLRAARARRDISQGELAKRTGLNLTTISQYEDGAFVPGADKIIALAEALGVTPNDLMGWE